MQSPARANYAFIDAQNLNFGLNKLEWKIDWRKFRTYLTEERNVEVAYVFIGFMLGNQDLYLVLQKAGFVVVFKEVFMNQSGDVKGNIDAELILQAMIDYDRYDRALIVSGDGDFTCLLRYLEQNGKLEGVIAPYEKSLSSLIERAAAGKIEHLRSLRRKLEYKYGPGGIKKTGPKPERIQFDPEEGKEKQPTQKLQSVSSPKNEWSQHTQTQTSPAHDSPIQQKGNKVKIQNPMPPIERKLPENITSNPQKPRNQKSDAPKKTREHDRDGQYDGFGEM